MIESPYVGNVPLAVLLAQMLKCFQSPNPKPAIDGLFSQDQNGGRVNSIVSPPYSFPNYGAPSWYYGQCNGYTLCLINGVENLTQATALYVGYQFSATLGFSLRGQNPFLNSVRDAILSAVASSHFVGPREVVVAGYSAGGAIAFLMSTALQAAYPNSQPYVFTFGSPAPGSIQYCRTFNRNYCIRYFNYDDPVPFIPIVDSNIAAGALTQGVAWVADAILFAQPPGGVVILGDDTLRGAPLPTSNRPAGLNTAGWIFSGSQAQGGPHTLQTYIDNLTAAATLLGAGGGGGPLPDDTVPAPEQQGIAQLRAEAREIVNNVFVRAGQQQVADLVIPPPAAFGTYRQGRIWYVTFGGETITTGPTKRRAHGLANVGNDFLRRMQTQGVVDPATILVLFNYYFVAAQNPGGGFNPIMNVGVPQ